MFCTKRLLYGHVDENATMHRRNGHLMNETYITIEGEPYMIGNRLKDTRTKMNLSEDEMASRLGMTKESYVRMEHNKDWPSIAKLAEIAGTLGITTDYLLSGEHDLVKRPTQTFQCGEPACEWRVPCGDGKFYCPSSGCMKADAR